MSQENTNHCRKKIGLQCYLTIPRHVTIIYDNRIDFNKNKDVFKDLNEVPPSYYWFPYEYIDSDVMNKLDKTRVRLAGNEMEKETKHYVESLNHDPNWLKMVTIEIDKLLINREYINFFMQIYIQCIKDRRSNSSSQTLIILVCLVLRNWICHNSSYILILKQ